MNANRPSSGDSEPPKLRRLGQNAVIIQPMEMKSNQNLCPCVAQHSVRSQFKRRRTPNSPLGGQILACSLITVAVVLAELDAKAFLRVCNPLHRGHRHLEFMIARSARADRRDRPQPFEHSKSGLFHVFAVGPKFSSTRSWIVTHP